LPLIYHPSIIEGLRSGLTHKYIEIAPHKHEDAPKMCSVAAEILTKFEACVHRLCIFFSIIHAIFSILDFIICGIVE